MTTVADLIRTDHREMERLFSELKSPEKRALVAPDHRRAARRAQPGGGG